VKRKFPRRHGRKGQNGLERIATCHPGKKPKATKTLLGEPQRAKKRATRVEKVKRSNRKVVGLGNKNQRGIFIQEKPRTSNVRQKNKNRQVCINLGGTCRGAISPRKDGQPDKLKRIQKNRRRP